MCDYYVYKDISELPCSPEQIFAKIIMPRVARIFRRALIRTVTPSVVSRRPPLEISIKLLNAFLLQDNVITLVQINILFNRENTFSNNSWT